MHNTKKAFIEVRKTYLFSLFSKELQFSCEDTSFIESTRALIKLNFLIYHGKKLPSFNNTEEKEYFRDIIFSIIMLGT